MSDFEQYYIHRKGDFVGNAPMWWAKGGNGYTSYILGAERFSREDADALIRRSGEKYKAYLCADVDARLHLVYDVQDDKRLGTDEPCGWPWGYAAIASMQGEAVGVVTLADDIAQPDTSGEHKGKYQNMIYSSAPLQVGAHVFTSPPNASAEIARLTKELEEARKDAGRWQAICNLWLLCSELKLIQNEDGGYSICEMEFVDNLLVSDFCGDTPEHTIDAAISKIGGGE